MASSAFISSEDVADIHFGGKMSDLIFKTLGPVRAYEHGIESDLLKPLKPLERLFLAVLLLAGGRIVGKDQLIRQLWGTECPADPYGRLQSCAHAVRTVLRKAVSAEQPPDPVPFGDGGYRVIADAKRVDVLCFHSQDKEGDQRAGQKNYAEAVRYWRESLSEWGSHMCGLRGPRPLEGLPGQWVEDYRYTLQNQHRAVILKYADARLRLGEHRDLISELDELLVTYEDQRDQELAYVRMCAYYESDRSADALEIYRRIAELLRKEGRQPGEKLRRLYEHIQNDEPGHSLSIKPHQGEPSQSAGSGKRAFLRIRDPDGHQSTFVLGDREVWAGRPSDGFTPHIAIESDLVSRYHCRLTRDNESHQWWLEPRGKNPVSLRKRGMAEPKQIMDARIEIHDGDVICIRVRPKGPSVIPSYWELEFNDPQHTNTAPES